MDKKLTTIREEFIESIGLVAQAEGLPRIAGRLFGLMVFDQGPVSFSELAEQLQVSRGSISSSARQLEELGVIRRTTKAGNRQDYFQLADNPYLTLLNLAASRANRAKETIDRTLEQIPNKEKLIRKRVAEYATFYDTMQQNLADAAKKIAKS